MSELEPEPTPAVPAEPTQAQLEEVRNALPAAAEVTDLRPFYAEEKSERILDMGLKKIYAFVLLGLLGFQIIVVDGVLTLYAWKGVHFKVDPVVIDIWLGATVIEVIGVVLVVTQHLFPRRGGERAE